MQVKRGDNTITYIIEKDDIIVVNVIKELIKMQFDYDDQYLDDKGLTQNSKDFIKHIGSIIRDSVLPMKKRGASNEDIGDAIHKQLKAFENKHPSFRTIMEVVDDKMVGEQGEPGLRDDDFLSFEQLRDVKEPEFIVDGLFRTVGVSYITAESKVGKTFYTIDQVCRISLGWNTLDGRMTTKTKVLYIASEDIETVAHRFIAWCLYHHVDPKDMNGNVVVYQKPLKILQEIPALIEKMKEKYPDIGLVVFDTQAASTRGVNENAKNEWDEVFERIGQLWREFNLAVWLVHHVGVSGKMRGTTDMAAEATTVMTLTKDKDVYGKHVIIAKPSHSRAKSTDGAYRVQVVDQNMGRKNRYGKDIYEGVVDLFGDIKSHDAPVEPGDGLPPAVKMVYDYILTREVSYTKDILECLCNPARGRNALSTSTASNAISTLRKIHPPMIEGDGRRGIRATKKIPSPQAIQDALIEDDDDQK